MLKNLKAFTLAEVMIVVAVIGITAMLTLPALNSNMEEKKVVSALRKVYPEIEASYTAMTKDYGKPVEWNTAASTSSEDMNSLLEERITRYLNVLTDCGTGTGCFTSSANIDSDENLIKFLLKDGSSVAFGLKSMSDMQGAYNTDVANTYDVPCQGDLGDIYVDVNGSKGENAQDYDIFRLKMCYGNGVIPFGNAAWVIKVGNRDYNKCAVNLDTKRTCE